MESEVFERSRSKVAKSLVKVFNRTREVITDGIYTSLIALRQTYIEASRGAVAALAKNHTEEEMRVLAPVVHGLIFRSYLEVLDWILKGYAVVISKLFYSLWLSLKGLSELTFEGLVQSYLDDHGSLVPTQC